MGSFFAIFAPASPAVVRITAGDYHFVEGYLLTDTEYADDPNDPGSVHLSILFKELNHPPRHLSRDSRGRLRISSQGDRRRLSGVVVTCDATHDRHLESIARAGQDQALG